MFRKILFWTHLSVGLAAAIGVVIMSITGVLIAYQPQIEQWADRRADPVVIPENAVRLDADALVAQAEASGVAPWPVSRITLFSDPAAPAFLTGPERGQLVRVNPYTLEEIGPGNLAVQKFFSVNIRLHRWLNIDGDYRVFALEFLSASNVLLLFLILSGIYLWFPQVMRWTLFKSRLWFTRSPTSKVRDFNWHHVFSVWALIPLAVVVWSGAKISYDWPDRVVYFVTGSEPPAPVQRVATPVTPDASQTQEVLTAEVASRPLQDYVAVLAEQFPDWQELGIELPKPGKSEISVLVDRGNGRQPHLEHTVTMDVMSAQITNVHSFTDESLGFRINDLMLPLHTGKVFGFWGQTLAMLSCVAALFLVWTGVALSWRRLIQPRLNRGR